MRLLPDGDKLFEVISRYNDLLVSEEREGYEPGDILALVAPFLVLHNVSEESVGVLAARATLTGGAAKLISWLQYDAWKIFCITTTYEQYAVHLSHRLGIYAHNVACTPFPLKELPRALTGEDIKLLEKAETDILGMYPPADEARLKKDLDGFFWKQLPAAEIGKAISGVRPVGGRRKVDALNRFVQANNQPLAKWVVVGDSIIDFRMLQAVEQTDGLAIAFNASEDALPYATIGVASTQIGSLTDVLLAWKKGQRKEVERLVKEKEKTGGSDDKGYFHWLSGRKNIDDVLDIHKRMRLLVRGEAGKWG